MQRSTESLLGGLLAAVERELPHAVQLRRRLHARPQLAHEEGWTAETVAAALPTPALPAAGSGRMARIGASDAPLVAVRAELDGLPVQERTGASFSASGDVMHACGHDVHMAALVALARAAHELSGELPAALLAVLQPSEEAYPSGAEQLASGELAAQAPAAIVAAHIHPELAWGSVAIDPGAVNASCDAFEITVSGDPSHGAYPHRGSDPVLALAQVIVALHALTARRIDPLQAAALTVGVVEAAGSENVIPAQARARGALRAHRGEDRQTLRALVEQVSRDVASAHGCSASVTLIHGEPPLENDPAIVAAARDLLPAAGLQVAGEWRSCGSDDFSFFAALAPIAMAFVGLEGAEGFQARPLHHPELLPPDEAVGAVARTQAVLFLAAAASLEARAVSQ